MTVWYTIYTRKDPPCKFCDTAKELLQVYGCDYYEIDITEPGVAELFKEHGFRTVPQVFREQDYIGGCEKLKEHLRNEQKQEEQKYRSQDRGSYTSA